MIDTASKPARGPHRRGSRPRPEVTYSEEEHRQRRADLERLEMQIARGLGRRPNYTQEQWQQLSPEARQLFSLLPPAPPRRESYRNNGPTDVYRFYDRAGELLYVGLSCSIAARVGAHRHEHGWWSEVKWIEVEHLPSRDAAAQQEKRLIAWLVPRYNRNGGGA